MWNTEDIDWMLRTHLKISSKVFGARKNIEIPHFYRTFSALLQSSFVQINFCES